MGEKTIRICDGCGKHLEKTSQIYRLKLTTDRFWDGVESTWLEKNLDFCWRCAEEVKNALIRIANRN